MLIKFKGKTQTVYNMDDTICYQYVKVPKLTRGHCDMAAFRNSRRFGAYANSDMFLNMLTSVILPHLKKQYVTNRRTLSESHHIRLDNLPSHIKANTLGPLTEIIITLEDN